MSSNFSTNLTNLLKQRGMTQKSLSEKTGLNEVTISRYVSGTSVPSSESAKKIAEALQVSIGELLGESSQPQTEENKNQNGDGLTKLANFCSIAGLILLGIGIGTLTVAERKKLVDILEKDESEGGNL